MSFWRKHEYFIIGHIVHMIFISELTGLKIHTKRNATDMTNTLTEWFDDVTFNATIQVFKMVNYWECYSDINFLIFKIF